MIRRPPRSTLCPDTTLFRSRRVRPELDRPGVHRAVLVRVLAAVLWRQPAADPDLLQPPATVDHDGHRGAEPGRQRPRLDRKSTRLNSSHANIPYAVFCLK